MYEVWIWDEDLLDYIPERRDGKRVEYEHWHDAANDSAIMYHQDGERRKVAYRGATARRRRA